MLHSTSLHFPLTFQHRAGVSPYTSSLDFAETCVFVKQLLGPFLCGHSLLWLPFSLTYGVNLPSSLTTLLPLVLGFSPRLPVSVCGTGTFILNSSFSCQCRFIHFSTCFSLPFRPSNQPVYFTSSLSTSLGRALPFARLDYLPASLLLFFICR